jgi:hypothetical protein
MYISKGNQATTNGDRKMLKKVYFERQEKTEYWESDKNIGWIQKTNDYGDSIFTTNNTDHIYINIICSEHSYITSFQGLIFG